MDRIVSSEKKQCVCLNSTYSTKSDVSSGVIQGSVIGSFFALYIIDLTDHCKDDIIKLFADNFTTYKCIPCQLVGLIVVVKRCERLHHLKTTARLTNQQGMHL